MNQKKFWPCSHYVESNDAPINQLKAGGIIIYHRRVIIEGDDFYFSVDKSVKKCEECHALRPNKMETMKLLKTRLESLKKRCPLCSQEYKK